MNNFHLPMLCRSLTGPFGFMMANRYICVNLKCNLTFPTVLYILGWRLFFYSNEGAEPIHVHAEKGDMECKYWLLVEEFDIKEAFSFNMSPTATKEIKRIIYQHFDMIVDSWNKYFNRI